MKVYRYEDSFGMGPYQASGAFATGTPRGKLTEALYAAHTKETGHPGWFSDGLPQDAGHLSGCKTLRGLRAWFRGFGPELEACGYYVAVYEAQVVDEGLSGKQVAFRKARRISWAGVDGGNIAL